MFNEDLGELYSIMFPCLIVYGILMGFTRLSGGISLFMAVLMAFEA